MWLSTEVPCAVTTPGSIARGDDSVKLVAGNTLSSNGSPSERPARLSGWRNGSAERKSVIMLSERHAAPGEDVKSRGKYVHTMPGRESTLHRFAKAAKFA